MSRCGPRSRSLLASSSTATVRTVRGDEGEAARVASRDGLEIELLFDRASAQLLTSGKVVADQDAHLLRLPVGTVVVEQLYLERTVINGPPKI